MSNNRRFLIIYSFNILIIAWPVRSIPNSTSWTALNVLVDNHHTDSVQTTETFGILIRSNDSIASAPTKDPLWTKVQVSQPSLKSFAKANNISTSTKRYHATLGKVTVPISTTTKSPPVKGEISENDFASSVVDGLMNWANRSLKYFNSSQLFRKRINGEEGHAFFDYDDDDDDDEDDDYHEDDDYDDDKEYTKKDELEEVEEVEEPPVEEVADPVEAQDPADNENYAETRPPIILRTRRKNKRKRGKKHGHIKLKHFKKLKKFMLPLLIAYKLKFFTLVPLLLGGLMLIVATTGFAGFFFALFAVGLGEFSNRKYY